MTPEEKKFYEQMRDFALEKLKEGEERPEPIPWETLHNSLALCTCSAGINHEAARRVLRVVEEKVVPWIEQKYTVNAAHLRAEIEDARRPGGK